MQPQKHATDAMILSNAPQINETLHRDPKCKIYSRFTTELRSAVQKECKGEKCRTFSRGFVALERSQGKLRLKSSPTNLRIFGARLRFQQDPTGHVGLFGPNI